MLGPSRLQEVGRCGLSLQSLIQGRSEREVVLRRVFYSQHSLPKNKQTNRKLSQHPYLYGDSHCSPQKSIGYNSVSSFFTRVFFDRSLESFHLRSGEDSPEEGQRDTPSAYGWPYRQARRWAPGLPLHLLTGVLFEIESWSFDFWNPLPQTDWASSSG